MKLVKLLIFFFSSGHYIKIVSWLLFGQNRNRTELISATWPLGKWEYENKKDETDRGKFPTQRSREEVSQSINYRAR